MNNYDLALEFVTEQFFDKWLDKETSYEDLEAGFKAGYNGDECPGQSQTSCSSYNHDYEYVESAYNIGKDIRDDYMNVLDAFIADVINGTY